MCRSNCFTACLILSLSLAVTPALLRATDDPRATPVVVEQKLSQKIRMVEHLLQSEDLRARIENSRDSLARELLARAEENFLQAETYLAGSSYLEAEAIIDYVLRDLSAASQLASVSAKHESKYRQFIEQLDAFALPEWDDLSEEETDFLHDRMQEVSELRARAIRLAKAESYPEAIEFLEQAYRLKASLLEQLRHETTVVYDLNFSTVQDEYRYLVERTYHFLEMVNLAQSLRIPDAQMKKLTDGYIYRSMLNLERAERLETEGQFAAAIPMLEDSITRLSAALKLLGVRI